MCFLFDITHFFMLLTENAIHFLLQETVTFVIISIQADWTMKFTHNSVLCISNHAIMQDHSQTGKGDWKTGVIRYFKNTNTHNKKQDTPAVWCLVKLYNPSLIFYFIFLKVMQMNAPMCIWSNSAPAQGASQTVQSGALQPCGVKYLSVIRKLKQCLFGCQSASEEDQVRFSRLVNKHGCKCAI